MPKVLPLPGKPTHPPPATPLNSVAEMLAELRAGRMVIVMDDEDRENEGDLIMAAEHGGAGGAGGITSSQHRHTLGVRAERRLSPASICRRWCPSTANRSAPRSPYRSTCASAPPPGCPRWIAPPR